MITYTRIRDGKKFDSWKELQDYLKHEKDEGEPEEDPKPSIISQDKPKKKKIKKLFDID